MNKHPLCLIYGVDGVDSDVTANMIRLYRRMGFRVVIGKTLFPCDLLVIQRGHSMPREQLLKIRNVRMVHVYQYVGKPLGQLSEYLRDVPHRIISPGMSLLEQSGFAKETWIQAPPPVYPELWHARSGRLKEVKYPFMHIGHHKPLNHDDEYAPKFDAMVRSGNIDIWGNGWEGVAPQGRSHGKLHLLKVRNIYEQAAYGFGLMYPFQRNSGTFSGRFWQGPINGTFILTEPACYSLEIPGIISTDYTCYPSMETASIEKRQFLAEESRNYWREKTEKLEKKLLEFCDQSELGKTIGITSTAFTSDAIKRTAYYWTIYLLLARNKSVE